jgi:hypothetical protein
MLEFDHAVQIGFAECAFVSTRDFDTNIIVSIVLEHPAILTLAAISWVAFTFFTI